MYVGWRDIPVDSSVLGSLSADFVSQSSKCPSLNFRRCLPHCMCCVVQGPALLVFRYGNADGDSFLDRNGLTPDRLSPYRSLLTHHTVAAVLIQPLVGWLVGVGMYVCMYGPVELTVHVMS